MVTEAVAAASGASATTTAARTTSISDMTGYDFLKLLITELSNQDPMDPMDNKEILNQLSSIRSLESNMELSENFKELLSSQGLVTATALIGQLITGIDTQGQLIEGKVERVMLDASGLSLQIGDRTVPLSKVMNVASEEAADAT